LYRAVTVVLNDPKLVPLMWTFVFPDVGIELKLSDPTTDHNSAMNGAMYDVDATDTVLF
jgi:hypothetical protein